MGISFNKKKRIFHLYTKEFSYYIYINELGYLIHLYSGEYLDDLNVERINERYMERFSYYDNELNKEICNEDYYFSMLASQFECAPFGKGDKRNYYSRIIKEDGIDITNFLYVSHKLIKGPVFNKSLPHIRFLDNEATTLLITLKEENSDTYLELYYVISEKF